MDGKPISLKAIDDKNVRGMNRVLVVFSDGLLSELDSARGLVSRSAWIRQAVEDKLMKEAVAPLVPQFSIEGEPLNEIDAEIAGVQSGQEE